MDLQAVKQLAKLMEETGLTTLEVEKDGERISLKKEVPAALSPIPAAAVSALQQPQIAAPAAAPEAAENDSGEVVNFNDVKEIKSPMVGTVYVASSPGADPYVHVGDKIKKGQVLCVIEAMKLMNEFTAPQSGEIVDICIEDGQLVEYGQCLFKIY
ncbi:MAG TPA: acetyl-CoA carboxylase biotin carboxyl carrier protein [Ruminococcaceae bacterium]|jgi:acetyl-CoA carboxylase biotin carboxyl carrier protein|nr:acetyl-CoA carboxylase biotin carboxyl carrier protein [Oscillospiraceae bacterium]HCA71282.1 acetyl-CoA carboxylase biotin carboxyl carrier protein [Oscillospiraceae bacterium]HCM22722.1 acetyl-CoA carboxylase biotin carboxyl carrier protein [Oscillospiraceae bacterium]